jgi:carbamoyltransferase
MNILSVYPSHDSNISVYINGEYRIYEIERLIKKRYAILLNEENSSEILSQIKDAIQAEFGDIVFDLLLCLRGYDDFLEKVKEHFVYNEVRYANHHDSHADVAFYLSPYDKAIVVSSDGGGFDEDGVTFFKVYEYDRVNGCKLLEKIDSDLGIYSDFGYPISEFKKYPDRNNYLAFAGKIMGLYAYGNVRTDWKSTIKKYYKTKSNINTLEKTGKLLGLDLSNDSLSGQLSYDLSATSQKVFEELFIEQIQKYINKDLPLCLTGGCALNVVLNEYIRKDLGKEIFVPPNPNDCGLGLGMILGKVKPKTPPDVTYKGFPILDIDKLPEYVEDRNAVRCSIDELCSKLSEGKIIGIVNGDSEIGPRALGNRSIICDPSFPDMKNVLNAKVKFREWFRPFAPFVKREECNKFFEFDHDAEYMSFAPKVRDEYAKVYVSIAHIDNTARVQTVTEKSHNLFYNILNEYEKQTGKQVLLNTSFNIKGNPILTTIEDALYVVDNTELDYVWVEGYLFKKGNK